MSNINKEMESTKVPPHWHSFDRNGEFGQRCLLGIEVISSDLVPVRVRWHITPSSCGIFCNMMIRFQGPRSFSIKHLPPSLACEQVLAKTVRWHWTLFCFDNHCLPYPRALLVVSSNASLLCVHLPQRLNSRVAKRVSSEGKWNKIEPHPTTLSLCDFGKLLNFLVTLSPHP